jgi:hypothetical protein
MVVQICRVESFDQKKKNVKLSLTNATFEVFSAMKIQVAVFGL